MTSRCFVQDGAGFTGEMAPGTSLLKFALDNYLHLLCTEVAVGYSGEELTQELGATSIAVRFLSKLL